VLSPHFGLAKALFHSPQLLILDEPANGLDPAGIVEIRNLLLELAQAQGVTVFMSSHILGEVARLAQRIGIIHRGRLLQELDVAELERNRRRQLVLRTRDSAAARTPCCAVQDSPPPWPAREPSRCKRVQPSRTRTRSPRASARRVIHRPCSWSRKKTWNSIFCGWSAPMERAQMRELAQAFSVEMLKARAFGGAAVHGVWRCAAAMVGGFFMIVLKDPELAQRVGLISAKAQILAGAADWPTYLELLAQGLAVGGIILFGFIGSWVFGREYADHTVKDLLALPMPRTKIVAAKFLLITIWSAALVILVLLLGLGIGALIGLAQGVAAVAAARQQRHRGGCLSDPGPGDARCLHSQRRARLPGAAGLCVSCACCLRRWSPSPGGESISRGRSRPCMHRVNRWAW
jgi:hypothetical protein